MTKCCVLVLVLLACCDHCVCSKCDSVCTWLSWKSWNSCSGSCGGGIQTRHRSACCKHTSTFDQCMSECHMHSSDSSESRCCNKVCYNAGRWTITSGASCSGHCSCQKGFIGNCCQTRCPQIENCLANETECNFFSKACTKCQPPYISTGWKGTCRAPSCVPVCQHNGTCIADDICSCAPGYLGSTCAMGGNVDAFLLPSLHAVDETPFKLLSWYDNPPYSEFGRICYLKVEIINSPVETLMIATSSSKVGKIYGNFTTGPVDIHGGLNDTVRTACLQYRCPITANGNTDDQTNITVIPVTRTGFCKVRATNQLMNVTVNSMLNNQETINILVNSNENYGPTYGIYIGTGVRNQAVYFTRQQCLSGQNFNVNNINPSLGVLVEYDCTK